MRASTPISLRPSSNCGFSLVEVTLALGLMSFCLVAMIGVLPIGLKQEKFSAEKIRALEAVTAVANNLLVNSTNLTNSVISPRYEAQVNPIGGATSSGVLLLDERFEKTGDQTTAAYKVWYTISPPKIRYDAYTVRLCLAKAAPAASVELPSQLGSKDYVETVITKSVL